MLQAQWTDEGIGIFDVEPGRLKPGWVRLKVSACGICGSDLHTYRRELPMIPGGVPGHEVVGTVMEGPQELSDSLYAVEPWVVCGSCDMCLSMKRNLCRERHMIGARQPGGLGEFVDVPAYAVHPVSPEVSPLVASIAEPIAVCVRAIHRARLSVDSRVLVLGGGTIGLLSGLLARDRAVEIAISVRYPHQRLAAQELGLTTIDEAQVASWASERKPDAVIETVGGSGGSLQQAVKVCRPSGRIVVLGVFTQPPAINALRVVAQELEMIGSFIYGLGQHGSEFGTAVSLLLRYKDEVARIQTHQFPLASVAEAFACANDKQNEPIKVTVLP